MRPRPLLLLALPLLALACPAKSGEVPPPDSPTTTDTDEPGAESEAGGESAGSEAFAIPRFQRTNLGASGLSAYLPPNFPDFVVAPSEDGSEVYTSELEQGGFVYGCIAVRFGESVGGGSPDEFEGVLIAYLDFLKVQVGITGAAGYGLGHRLEGEDDVRGVIDFWEDAQGTQYAIKGWVSPTHLAVLYIAGPSEYPVFNAQQMYLEGIRFSPVPE